MSPEEFLARARAYAASKYAYAEFADDNEDGIPAALAADETPEYWIERLAEKYALNPINNGWN